MTAADPDMLKPHSSGEAPMTPTEQTSRSLLTIVDGEATICSVDNDGHVVIADNATMAELRKALEIVLDELSNPARRESPAPTTDNRFAHWSSDLLSETVRGIANNVFDHGSERHLKLMAAADRLDALYFGESPADSGPTPDVIANQVADAVAALRRNEVRPYNAISDLLLPLTVMRDELRVIVETILQIHHSGIPATPPQTVSNEQREADYGDTKRLDLLEAHAVSATVEVTSNGPRAFALTKRVGNHREHLTIGAKSLREAIDDVWGSPLPSTEPTPDPKCQCGHEKKWHEGFGQMIHGAGMCHAPASGEQAAPFTSICNCTTYRPEGTLTVRHELKLYACDRCSHVVALTKAPVNRCAVLFASLMSGRLLANFPQVCNGEYERIEELQITPIP